MRIEVATLPSAPKKDKGDLLEDLSVQVLRQQQFDVTQQVRKTASELDLLCKHKVSERTLYAECKAYRDTLSANALTNVLGKLHFHDYDEAWVITTGPLGKDAKGFLEEWSTKPPEERKRLSVYTPDRIVDLLCCSRFIVPPPSAEAERATCDNIRLGDWTLLITEYGIFWVVVILDSGVPAGVFLYNGKDGTLITDITLLRRLGETDSTVTNLDLEFFSKLDERAAPQNTTRVPKVVQVQSGDDWADYRPARPEHFVGRHEAQRRLLGLLSAIRRGETRTRVFAITGDSGMGKSSLIAKLRDRCSNVRNRRKVFLFPVDVRAATEPTYVHASLLTALTEAAKSGFGEAHRQFEVTDYADPLASESIRAYVRSLEVQEQVVCLVFDQFEELYSKPELFSVFEEAQRLFLSAISARSAVVLGFAWKTDSTVQQGHPAYFMWHRLADHRFEVGLSPFSHSEASSALTLFEKEIGTKIRPELRRQLIENSQGFPWLIKKLCLHLWEQIQQGVSQEELAETLDVASLFDRDLQALTTPESTCLKSVAKSAPADWYEVIDTYGEEVLRSLQQRRLVVRSGDRLNVYWDIFRDYLVTQKIPSLPYTYLPSAPSINALLRVAAQLDHNKPRTFDELVQASSVKGSTAQNIIHDLVMFGVATGTRSHLLLDERVESATAEHILYRIRDVLRRHALTRRLSRFDRGETIRQDDMIETLKTINRAAQHRVRTWRVYADRMGRWLVSTGLAISVPGGWQLQDRGEVSIPAKRRRRYGTFLGDAPPDKAIEAARWLRDRGRASRDEVKVEGYRNAFLVLVRFGIVKVVSDAGGYELSEEVDKSDLTDSVWSAAKCNPTLARVVDYLKSYPSANGAAVATHVSETSEGRWSEGSKIRVGNGLRRWAKWLISGENADEIPDASKVASDKGRARMMDKQRSLFDA